METEVQEGVPARAADPDGAAGARPRSEAASRGAAQGRARDSLGSTGHAPHSGGLGGGLGRRPRVDRDGPGTARQGDLAGRGWTDLLWP